MWRRNVYMGLLLAETYVRALQRATDCPKPGRKAGAAAQADELVKTLSNNPSWGQEQDRATD